MFRSALEILTKIDQLRTPLHAGVLGSMGHIKRDACPKNVGSNVVNYVSSVVMNNLNCWCVC